MFSKFDQDQVLKSFLYKYLTIRGGALDTIIVKMDYLD